MTEEYLQAIGKAGLLLVEGRDDRRFFSALLHHLGIRNVDVREMHGRHNLRIRVRVITELPGFRDSVTAFGIVRDANSDPAAAFQSMCDALRAAGLEVPGRCGEPCGEAPRVGVMILPSESEPGALEDVCLRAVEDDPAMPCVDEYFDCLSGRGLETPRQESKGRVHTFLASRERAGLRLGEAAEAGYWPWEASTFLPVKDFLKGLFAAAC